MAKMGTGYYWGPRCPECDKTQRHFEMSNIVGVDEEKTCDLTCPNCNAVFFFKHSDHSMTLKS